MKVFVTIGRLAPRLFQKLSYGKQVFLFHLYASLLSATVLSVKAGESIQNAVNLAKPGDTVEVSSGIYKESIIVSSPKVSLIGKLINGQYPVLEGEGQRNDGVTGNGSGLRIENFRIQNYKGNGIVSPFANDMIIRHIEARETGSHGIRLTDGKNILIERSVTWGSSDAGIYVGRCENVDMRHNEVFSSTAGIESDNSTNVLIERNSTHDNAGGILIFNLPGLPTKHGETTIVRGNTVVSNNRKNTATAHSIVSTIPSGSGIVLIAADKVTIENNVITDNQSAGIIVGDHDYIKDVSILDPAADPNPDNNRILENEFKNNGARPKGTLRWTLLFHFYTLKGRDVIAYDSGKDNCLLPGVTQSQIGMSHFVPCISKPHSTSGFYRDLASRPNVGVVVEAEVKDARALPKKRRIKTYTDFAGSPSPSYRELRRFR